MRISFELAFLQCLTRSLTASQFLEVSRGYAAPNLRNKPSQIGFFLLIHFSLKRMAEIMTIQLLCLGVTDWRISVWCLGYYSANNGVTSPVFLKGHIL